MQSNPKKSTATVNKIFALVDCNNFYASCERVFNPAIRNQPVVVLSNNDGCVIARSAEAKQLGIKMGIPAFQIEKLIDEKNVAVFSSNYALYGDMSQRVMSTLSTFSPSVEIYSIDEAFLDLTGFPESGIKETGLKIRQTVYKNTGIPVGIGIASTKTLAKIANYLSKKDPAFVCWLNSEEKIREALHLTSVSEVWGIGRQHSSFLNRHGIATAFDFTQAPDNWIKKNFSVTGLRTKKELAGISCIIMDESPSAKKAICTSRSFGQAQTLPEQLEEAVATFTMKCAEKLRHQQTAASQVMVFIHTNAFRPELSQYASNRVITLSPPTNNSIELVKAARLALRSIYKPGFQYIKAGVIVTGLVPDHEIQQDIFNAEKFNKQKELMQTIDRLNRDIGQNTLKIATQGSGRKWKLKQEKLSSGFTTHWDQLIEVKV